MKEDLCSEVRLSQGRLLPGFGKMMTSKDVGLVVVGADLVGLVDRHTHRGCQVDFQTGAAGVVTPLHNLHNISVKLEMPPSRQRSPL